MNGEEGITDLVRGCILPLQEKHAELFKKEGGVFKKTLMFLKILKVFLQHTVQAAYL